MSTTRVLLAAALFAFTPAIIYSQSPKKLCDAGEKLEKANNLNEAIDNYSKAIELDINFQRAYALRASCLEKAGKKAEAINDYITVTGLNTKEKLYPYRAAFLLADLGRLQEADKMYRKVFTYDRTYKEAIEGELKVLIRLRDFDYGITVSQMGMDAKKTASSIFWHAVMHDSLNHPQEAEKYYKLAIAEDSKFIPAYLGLASALVKLGKYDEAYANCQTILSKEPSNMEALFIKSEVFASKK